MLITQREANLDARVRVSEGDSEIWIVRRTIVAQAAMHAGVISVTPQIAARGRVFALPWTPPLPTITAAVGPRRIEVTAYNVVSRR